MKDIQEAVKKLGEFQEGLAACKMHGLMDALAPIVKTLEVYAAPDRAKRQKICAALRQEDVDELEAGMVRYAKMGPLRRLLKYTALTGPFFTLPPALIDDLLLQNMREFARNNEYTFDGINALLYAYLQTHELYLSMEGPAFMEALLDKADDVSTHASHEASSLCIYNGTKGIALTMYRGRSDAPLRLVRTRFLQHGAADAAFPCNDVASHFDGRMPLSAVCGIRCQKDGLEDMLIERFTKREAWWRPLFLFLMDRATYGDCSIVDASNDDDDNFNHESWTMTIADAVSIYCYRGPAGEIDTLCFSDPSHVGVQEGIEMHPSDPLYRWTVDTLRATVANLQTRTLAMFDGKSWFRHQNKPFVETAEEGEGGEAKTS